MTAREQRFLRFSAIGISIYLVLFFALRPAKRTRSSVATYDQLVSANHQLELELNEYETKKLLLEKLQTSYGSVVNSTNRSTLVADASSAIQNEARSGGIQLGPLHESSGRTSTKEMGSMQLEGIGPVPAITTFLYRLNTLGYPLVIDSIQLTPDHAKPGMLKFNLTIVIIDVEQWKKEASPNV